MNNTPENPPAVEQRKEEAVTPPTEDELNLWRSRCAVLSGDWKDLALFRTIRALAAKTPPKSDAWIEEAGSEIAAAISLLVYTQGGVANIDSIRKKTSECIRRHLSAYSASAEATENPSPNLKDWNEIVKHNYPGFDPAEETQQPSPEVVTETTPDYVKRWQDAGNVTKAQQPAAGETDICYLFLCESTRLGLRPNVTYQFHVDPHCQKCLELEKAHALPEPPAIIPDKSRIKPLPGYPGSNTSAQSSTGEGE